MSDEFPEDMKEIVASAATAIYKRRTILATPVGLRLFRATQAEETEDAFARHAAKLLCEILTITGHAMPVQPNLSDRGFSVTPRSEITEVKRLAAVSELHEQLLKIYPGVSLTLAEAELLFKYAEAAAICESVRTLRAKDAIDNN